MYEFDYVDEIILIRFLQASKGLYVCWLPGNQSIVTITQPNKVLINASDYNYPILPEKTTRLISYALSGSSLKHYGLVKSNYFYGQIAINLLLKRLTNTQIDLILFDRHVEGIRWILRN